MATSADSEVQKREKRGRAYPNPSPNHPISERLEHVRSHFGYQSKRSFWQRVCDGWDQSVSYEAVRNYHYDREPPPSYLARVSEVFGVQLEWLITGKGGMFAFPTAKGLSAAVLDACPVIREASPGIQARFADLLFLYWVQAPDHAPRHSTGEVSEIEQLAGDLDTLLTLPLRWWGFVHLDDIYWSDRETYLHQFIGALHAAVLGARLGNPLSVRPTPFMTAVEEALEEATSAEPLPWGEDETA